VFVVLLRAQLVCTCVKAGDCGRLMSGVVRLWRCRGPDVERSLNICIFTQ